MKSPGVYRIYCRATGRNYVGSSCKDWKNRRNGHVCLLKKGTHPSIKMQEDWGKFGPESFEFILVCECSPDNATDMELAASIEFKAFCPDAGYNIKPISSNRFRSGRKPEEISKIRFSRMVTPDMAKKLAELMKVPGGSLIKLEHPNSHGGWKESHRDPNNPKVIGLNPDSSFDGPPKPRYGDDQVVLLKMAEDSQEVIKLKSRVKELESKLREYEGY